MTTIQTLIAVLTTVTSVTIAAGVAALFKIAARFERFESGMLERLKALDKSIDTLENEIKGHEAREEHSLRELLNQRRCTCGDCEDDGA